MMTEQNAALPDSFSAPAFVFDGTGVVVDTAGWHRFTASPGPNSITVDGLTMGMPDPLRDRELRFTHEQDDIVIDRSVPEPGEPAIFSVNRTTESGDTVYATRFAYSPRPVTADVVDDEVSRKLQSVAHLPVDQAALEAALREAMVMPTHHPPISLHRAGADGSVWLRRHDDGGDDWRWIVLRPDGTPRGELRLPRNAHVHWATVDEGWVVETDEYDVPYLVRYRVH